MHFGNKTSSVTPTTFNIAPPTCLSNRLKKVRILKEMNQVEDDILTHGFKLPMDLLDKMIDQQSFSVCDVEALQNLRIEDTEAEELKKADRGEYKHIDYECVNVAKDYSNEMSRKSFHGKT